MKKNLRNGLAALVLASNLVLVSNAFAQDTDNTDTEANLAAVLDSTDTSTVSTPEKAEEVGDLLDQPVLPDIEKANTPEKADEVIDLLELPEPEKAKTLEKAEEPIDLLGLPEPEKAKSPEKAETVADLTKEETTKEEVAKAETKAPAAKGEMLPDTGEGDSTLLLSSAAISILAGLGLVAGYRKQEN